MFKQKAVEFAAFFVIGFALALVLNKSQHLENLVIGFVPSAS